MKSTADSSFPMPPPPSYVVSPGGELGLSNQGQLVLLRGMAARGVALRMMVRGGSMSPFIQDKDVLTIVPMNGSAPRVGEIVAFVQPNTGRLAIHRVIARAGSGWLVRGDNCPRADGVVMGESIIGCVTRIERHGRPVHLALGMEARLIVLLQRTHLLMPAVRLLGRLKQLGPPNDQDP